VSQLRLKERLTGRGFLALTPAGSPPQLQWWYRGMNWRERLPFVRGYRRTVVYADVPVQSEERAAGIAREAFRICADGLPERLASPQQTPDPWWAPLLHGGAMLVALIAAVFFGVAIDIENRAWCVVLLPARKIGEGAREGMAQLVAHGSGFTGVVLGYDAVDGSIAMPDPREQPWRGDADARAVLKDLRSMLP